LKYAAPGISVALIVKCAFHHLNIVSFFVLVIILEYLSNISKLAFVESSLNTKLSYLSFNSIFISEDSHKLASICELDKDKSILIGASGNISIL
jgi:hypothetical protein